MTKLTPLATLTNDVLAEFSAAHEAPCLSLYQPTNRHHPENLQDPIRYRNLVRELGASLRQDFPAAEAAQLLEPFEALADDADFWKHSLDGLAVLGGPNVFLALRIPQPVAELVVVADSFHAKPLRRFLQSADRYQVLALSLDKIRMYEGNRHTLDALDLAAGVPDTLAEGPEGTEGARTEPHPPVARAIGAASDRMHHGHSVKSEESDADAVRFFRAVDRAVLEHYSRPSGLPLILAALPEHHHLFRQVSQNPLLVDEGVRVNPDALSPEALRAAAWRVMEPRYQARLAALGAEFALAQARGLGSDSLDQVAIAASAGRVATVLIAADRHIPGHLDEATGRLDFEPLSDPHVDDLLDDLGELVAKLGGAVVVIPSDRMPSRSGVAAIYRY